MQNNESSTLPSLRISYLLYVLGGINFLVLLMFLVRYRTFLRYLLFKTEPFPEDPGKTLTWFVHEGASITVFSLYWFISLMVVAVITGVIVTINRKKSKHNAPKN